MSKSANSKRNKERKLKARRRKKLQRQHESGSSLIVERKSTSRLGSRLDDVLDLLERGDAAEAMDQLNEIAERHGNNVEVLQLQCAVASELRDDSTVCASAQKWLRLRPGDFDAAYVYGGALAGCGKACAAFVVLREVSERANWQEQDPALGLIADCRVEAERRVNEVLDSGWIDVGFDDGGVELVAEHELVLQLLEQKDFRAMVAKCHTLIQKAPNFLSVRNNLSLGLFMTGETRRALDVARESCNIDPRNEFAEASLGKLYFLSGEIEKAEEISQRIIEPAERADPFVAQLEFFSFLGLDQKVLEFTAAWHENGITDPSRNPMVMHFEAVARYRLGEEEKAKTLWQESAAQLPDYAEAADNLRDIEDEGGHAAWASSCRKWLPKSILDELNGGKKEATKLPRQYPAIVKLLPAMLDRGDPLCRELAMFVATALDSPESVQVRKDFALSNRGPFKYRFEFLGELVQDGIIDAGPYRVFTADGWKEVLVSSTTITYEAIGAPGEWESKLSEEAYYAMHNGDFDRAEELYEQLLARNPESVSAQFNLANVWLSRDGVAGAERGARKIREIHERHPEYVFAASFVAMKEAEAGNFDRAYELLHAGLNRDVLHFSEAKGLYLAQAHVAIKQGFFELAESSLDMVEEISGEDDDSAMQLRIELGASKLAKNPKDKLDVIHRLLSPFLRSA